jgi:hypothetical protein
LTCMPFWVFVLAALFLLMPSLSRIANYELTYTEFVRTSLALTLGLSGCLAVSKVLRHVADNFDDATDDGATPSYIKSLAFVSDTFWLNGLLSITLLPWGPNLEAMGLGQLKVIVSTLNYSSFMAVIVLFTLYKYFPTVYRFLNDKKSYKSGAVDLWEGLETHQKFYVAVSLVLGILFSLTLLITNLSNNATVIPPMAD